VEDKFKRSNFPFGKKIKFPIEFELKILEQNKDKFRLNFAGAQTGMHYTTRRFHWMQKYKFSVTCPNALFVESKLFPLVHGI
jgi:hypothetical protein